MTKPIKLPIGVAGTANSRESIAEMRRLMEAISVETYNLFREPGCNLGYSLSMIAGEGQVNPMAMLAALAERGVTPDGVNHVAAYIFKLASLGLSAVTVIGAEAEFAVIDKCVKEN